MKTEFIYTQAEIDAVVKRLGGTRKGANSWQAKCPSHDDRKPSLSLSLNGGKLVWRCFAGCSQESVWEGLRDLLASNIPDRDLHRLKVRASQSPERDVDEERRIEFARQIWKDSGPVTDTFGQAYLKHRGISIDIPQSIRYHGALKHGPTGLLLPAVIGAVQGPDRSITAVQRIYIRQDGRGKAGINNAKLSLGKLGTGALRLGPATPAIGICEGLETGLSAMEMFGLPIWCALGARMDQIELPDCVAEAQIFGDNGDAGHAAAEKAAERYASQGRQVLLRYPPEEFGDWNDVLVEQRGESSMTEVYFDVDELPPPIVFEPRNCVPLQDTIPESPYPQSLRPVSIGDFLRLDLPEREMLVTPIIPRQGLVMIHAQRGVGKTHVSLALAWAAATGSKFLRWEAEAPRRVLYIDGEMAAVTMQERVKLLAETSGSELEDENGFRLLTPDLYAGLALPDISTTEGQAEVDGIIEDAELIFLDNLSCLCRTGNENESESWQSIQDWLLKLRREGRSIVLVHHQGKGGKQRGTSRREDILDTVVSLKRPADYHPNEGARFEVHIEKGRHITGTDADPFEVTLREPEGWTFRMLEDAREIAIIRLFEDGITNQREIKDELGCGLGTVSRAIKKLRAEGRLPAKG